MIERRLVVHPHGLEEVLLRLAGKADNHVGREADVIVVDPARTWMFSSEEIRSKSKNSPFIGRTLTGQAVHTFVSGRHIVSDGRLVSELGAQVAANSK